MLLIAVASATSEAPNLPLANWETKIYQYDLRAAAKAGFSVVSFDGSADARLLVMDTMRSVTERAGDIQRVWGCGFRLLVEVSDIKLAGRLTLPGLAASVETSALRVNIQLEVKGYDGDEMWAVLPTPKELNVESYRIYIGAAEKIQQTFAANPGKAKAVLLAEGTIDILAGGIGDLDAWSAVIVVWTLEQLAAGHSAKTATQAFADTGITHLGAAAVEIIEGTYALVVGAHDSDYMPTTVESGHAASYLESIRR